jgi:hypothetical protein
MDGVRKIITDVDELTKRLGRGTEQIEAESESVVVTSDNTPDYVHQLHAARYAFHKVRCKMYSDAIQQGLLPLEEGRLRYKLAMQNYDELIKSSANGSVTEADQADMDKGFPL